MSKKSEQLGASATFAAVSQPMSSRSRAFAALNGQEPVPQPTVAAPGPSGAPRIPIGQLAHNPYNPREELRAVEEMADSLAARGIIQPVTVVTRSAFLAAHPGREESIGDAGFVVVDGNRRLAAARLAGLDELPAHVDDELAADADTLLETALVAAVQHEDLDPLDQAKALQRLVQVHGSQRAVARALGKTSPWVSQRLALLNLTSDLQQELEEKKLPIEDARRIGKLPQQQQAEAASEVRAARAKAKAEKTRRAANPESRGANGVSTPEGHSVAKPAEGSSHRAAAASGGAGANGVSTTAAVAVRESGLEPVVARRVDALSRRAGRAISQEDVSRLLLAVFAEDDRLFEALLARLTTEAGTGS